jgi:hypothetical protein
VQCHCSSTFYISELVEASCGIAVSVEELGYWCSVLREEGVVSALIPLLVIVDDMVSLRGEEFVQSLVLEDLIQDPDLVNGGFSASVSDSGKSSHCEEGEMNLPDESLVEHEEAEGGVCDETSGPAII